MTLNLNISKAISKKLFEKHDITRANPPTLWFIAETNQGRALKVVFIELQNGIYEIKTAYEPNKTEVKIYEDYA